MDIKHELMNTIKIILLGIIFSLFLIYVGKLFYQEPQFSFNSDKVATQHFYPGEYFLYNVTYEDISNQSYMFGYIYKEPDCFSFYMDDNYYGEVCRYEHYYPFPFLMAYPKEENASISFYARFDNNIFDMGNYKFSSVNHTNYKGYDAISFVNEQGDFYTVENSRGFILYVESSGITAELIEHRE